MMFIFAAEVVRIAITSRFVCAFVERNDDRLKRVLAYSISVFLTFTAYAFVNLPWLNLLSTLLGLIIIIIPYSGGIKKKIQFVLYVLAISCIIDLVVYALLSQTFDYDNYSESASILSLFLLFVVQLITRRILMKNKDEDLSVPHWWHYIISLVICIAASLIVIMDKTISSLSLSVVCGAFLAINLIVVYLFDDLIKTKQSEYENLILKDQAKAYEKELQLQKESTEKIKAFKHDIKYHLTQIKTLNQEGKTQKLDQYISEMAENLQEIVPISYTGNVGVDGVLNYMLQKAKDRGIAVCSRVVIPEDLEISVFDMNIILGNLIENAIEANEGVQIPRIEFLMKYANDTLFIEIANTHSNIIEVHEGIMISSKNDKNVHGYGIRNVKKVLSKYDHSLGFEEQNDMFIVRILMKK